MLTSTGRWVSAAAALLCALAVLLRYGELLVLGLGALGALGAAVLWMRQHPDVTITREIAPQRVSVGDAAQGILMLHNTSARRSPPFAAVERFGDREFTVAVPSLAPAGTATMAYALPTPTRGVFPVGPLTIGHMDPLRLMRVARTYASATRLWVHPAVHTVAPLPTGRSRDMDGPTTDASPRGGVAFHSLREYVPGDDRRLIHWATSARYGTLLVRNQVIPNEPRMHVVLDTSAAPYTDGSFEDAVRVAASLAVAACTRKYPCEVRTTGGLVSVATGPHADIGSMLDLFAEAVPSPDDGGLAELAKLAPPEEGVSLGVVSGQVTQGEAAIVGRIRQKYGMVTLITVGERFGRPAPQVQGVLSLNVATSEEFARAWPLLVRS